ncbi:MAG: hypothetical protein GY943_30855 [Chloroflexi bacterium]|nr:hypothetical protein [Chloroflexota bacterium]
MWWQLGLIKHILQRLGQLAHVQRFFLASLLPAKLFTLDLGEDEMGNGRICGRRSVWC